MPLASPLARIHLALAGALLGIAFAAAAHAQSYPEARRIVSVGGSVTEIIAALGALDRVVARDTTSSYPPRVEELPDVGYMRALSPEGVLSTRPDLVIAEEGSGPPETLEVLRAASVPFVEVPEGFDTEAVADKVRIVAATLGLDEAGEALVRDIDDRLTAARDSARAATGDTPPRVLFILSIQGGRILAAGRDTAAAGIIDLAGGQNAVTAFAGYKPLTDEALAAAAPQVILMMDRSGDHAADDDALFAHPALTTTPAARTGSVVRMDGLLLLGFGPRTPDAVERLSEALAQTVADAE
nr:ABC transporter substrate-binding protein [Mesobaculum littorinae]